MVSQKTNTIQIMVLFIVCNELDQTMEFFIVVASLQFFLDEEAMPLWTHIKEVLNT